MFYIVELKEYCQFEKFNATCRSDEVVIMKAALYGRMQFGRCVDRDYGYVGCSKNVLPQVDIRCSGRRNCTITVPDVELHAQQPCPKDLSAYLEAAYTCQKGKALNFISNYIQCAILMIQFHIN